MTPNEAQARGTTLQVWSIDTPHPLVRIVAMGNPYAIDDPRRTYVAMVDGVGAVATLVASPALERQYCVIPTRVSEESQVQWYKNFNLALDTLRNLALDEAVTLVGPS